MAAILKNWHVFSVAPNGVYSAPESCSVHLKGEVFGHPRIKDGSFVKTSAIIDCSGNLVYTQNSTYVLEEPSPDYEKWVLENYGHAIDRNHPIKNLGG